MIMIFLLSACSAIISIVLSFIKFLGLGLALGAYPTPVAIYQFF